MSEKKEKKKMKLWKKIVIGIVIVLVILLIAAYFIIRNMFSQPDIEAAKDDGLIADPDIAADDNVPPVVPGLRDLRDRRVPRLVEDGKGIGGQGLQRVVGAGEQEFRAAGDGAEFSDHQPVAVDGVVIEHIVAHEFRGVPEEIVVDRVIPHRNIGV